MVALVEVVTAVVLTVKLPVVVPAGTVTLAGTVAAPVLLLRDTTAPPAGAAPVSTTTPCELLPPTTLAGLTDNEDNDTGGAVDETVTVGSTAAYFRTNTLLSSATVFASPYRATR